MNGSGVHSMVGSSASGRQQPTCRANLIFTGLRAYKPVRDAGVNGSIVTVTNDNLYLSDVLLLCVTCKQPIRARINTPSWIKVEWISPEGECQACNAEKKAKRRMPTEAELTRDSW